MSNTRKNVRLMAASHHFQFIYWIRKREKWAKIIRGRIPQRGVRSLYHPMEAPSFAASPLQYMTVLYQRKPDKYKVGIEMTKPGGSYFEVWKKRKIYI